MAWLIGLLAKWMAPKAATAVAWLLVAALLASAGFALYYSVHHDGYVEGKAAMQPVIAEAKAETAREHELRVAAENSNLTLLKALKDQNHALEGLDKKAKDAAARTRAAVAALEEEVKKHAAEKARLVKRLKDVLDAPDLPTVEACQEATSILNQLATMRSGGK